MDAEPFDREQLAALVGWYADMGVDIAVSETPHNALADDRVRPAPTAVEATAPGSPASAAQASAAPARAAPRRDAPVDGHARSAQPGLTPAMAATPDAAAQSAREAALAATNLDDLRAALEAFDGCALKRTASRLVFCDGEPRARIMLVGEAPGAEEDRIGKPFVGRAGQLLDRMLGSIGLDRTKVYIANVVPWRPPGNRTPTPHETTVCLPFIERQIALVDPDVLVCLGRPSAETLLRVRDGIMKARGRWYDYTIDNGATSKTIRAIAMLHPAYLLRAPVNKALAWRDWRELAKELAKLDV